MAKMSLQEAIGKKFERLGGYTDGFFVADAYREKGKGLIQVGCFDRTGGPDYNPKRIIANLKKATGDALADHGLQFEFEDEYVEVDEDVDDVLGDHAVDLGIRGRVIFREWHWLYDFGD